MRSMGASCSMDLLAWTLSRWFEVRLSGPVMKDLGGRAAVVSYKATRKRARRRCGGCRPAVCIGEWRGDTPASRQHHLVAVRQRGANRRSVRGHPVAHRAVQRLGDVTDAPGRGDHGHDGQRDHGHAGHPEHDGHRALLSLRFMVQICHSSSFSI